MKTRKNSGGRRNGNSSPKKPSNRMADRKSKERRVKGTYASDVSESEDTPDSELSYTPPSKRQPDPKPSHKKATTKASKTIRKKAAESVSVKRAKGGFDKVLNVARVIQHQRKARKLQLNSIEKVRKLVAATVNEVRMALILPSHAEVVFKGCRLLLDLLSFENTRELESRIAELEKLRDSIE